jgi:hypothetical protein
MKTEKLIIVDENGFSKVIQEWTEETQVNFDVEVVDPKADFLDLCDGLVLFHENHNFSKETLDIKDFFDTNNRPTHKVDLNGTLAATVGNLKMWVERNKTKRLAILGSSELSKNDKLTRFLNKMID